LIRTSKFLTYALTLFSNNRLDVLERELVARQVEPLKAKAGYGTDEWRKRIASVYVGNRAKMCAVGRGAGFRVALFLQPMLALKRPLVGKEPAYVFTEEEQEHVRQTYGHVREATKQSAAFKPDEGCHAFDLSHIFLDYEREVYLDVVHINDEGNARAASFIYAALKDSGLAAVEQRRP
jgi:hypothetical protein